MVDLKESFYNFKVETNDGELVLYNTKTGAISVIDAIEKRKTLKIFDNPNIKSCDEEIKKGLFKLGFLVEKKKNELNDIKEWHENYISLDNLLNLTILPAEACNFSCPYCFNYKDRNIIMDDWVFNAIYKYISKFVKDRRTHPEVVVRITWFGGEPLLASDQIIDFMDSLGELKKENSNLIIQGDLVTNGFLLELDTFKSMLSKGINHFQVTIDGDEENHDKLRVLKGGKPTFNKIYNNILRISRNVEENFTFWIRGNFLKNNLDSMERLANKFREDFKDDSRFYLYFRPVQDFETNDKIEVISDSICQTSDLDLQTKLFWNTNQDVEKNDNIRIFDPLPNPTYSWCNMERKNQYIIGADGLVYFCDVEICNEDKSVGKITPEGVIIVDEDTKKEWKNSMFDLGLTGCFRCKMLPICLGGCKRVLKRTGKPICFWSKAYIEKQMKTYVNNLNI